MVLTTFGLVQRLLYLAPPFPCLHVDFLPCGFLYHSPGPSPCQ
jgi:hypothetical protein